MIFETATVLELRQVASRHHPLWVVVVVVVYRIGLPEFSKVSVAAVKSLVLDQGVEVGGRRQRGGDLQLPLGLTC